jgi:DeoR/GlpR family transcriptional regulator of sugar metabolism
MYHQEEKIVALKTEMLRSARRRVLLMDSSKFGHNSLHLMTNWQDIDQLITDDGVTEVFRDHLRSQGVEVHVVPVPAGQVA